MRGRSILSTSALAAGLGLAGCTAYDGYGYGHGAPPPVMEPGGRFGGYAYEGHDYGRGSQSEFGGRGAEILDPWLSETREGWFIVTRGFRDAADGYVSEEVAHRANIWFRRFADSDRDMRLTDREIRRALAWAATGPNIDQLR